MLPAVPSPLCTAIAPAHDRGYHGPRFRTEGPVRPHPRGPGFHDLSRRFAGSSRGRGPAAPPVARAVRGHLTNDDECRGVGFAVLSRSRAPDRAPSFRPLSRAMARCRPGHLLAMPAPDGAATDSRHPVTADVRQPVTSRDQQCRATVRPRLGVQPTVVRERPFCDRLPVGACFDAGWRVGTLVMREA